MNVVIEKSIEENELFEEFSTTEIRPVGGQSEWTNQNAVLQVDRSVGVLGEMGNQHNKEGSRSILYSLTDKTQSDHVQDPRSQENTSSPLPSTHSLSFSGAVLSQLET